MADTPRRRPRGRPTGSSRSGDAPRASRGRVSPGGSRGSGQSQGAGDGAGRVRASKGDGPKAARRRGSGLSRTALTAAGTGGAKGARARNGRPKLVRQVLILGLALILSGVTLALPWREFIETSKVEDAAIAKQTELEQQRRALELKRDALSDPDYIRVEAKSRLQYVEPGSTVYVFRGPKIAESQGSGPTELTPEQPWYSTLWESLSTPTNENP